MGKELDELRREYAKNEAKLQQYQHRAKRLEQRKQYYEKGERQKHVHCLITRGATVESIVPEVGGGGGMGKRNFTSLPGTSSSCPK